MTIKNINKIINYWKETAEHDYQTMLSLFQSKRYSDTLFYGHIILEKSLKACVVQHTHNHAPHIHDLVRLQEKSNLQLSEPQLNILDKVNDFNIRARYPDYKLKFYKQCTKEYTQKYLNEIVKLYKELCLKLTPKK